VKDTEQQKSMESHVTQMDNEDARHVKFLSNGKGCGVHVVVIG